MRLEARLLDPRRHRRNMVGLGAGALSGATVGALLGPWLPALGVAKGLAAGTLLGTIIGALIGRALVAAVSADDFEPGTSRRSYVGTPAPDDDLSR